MKKILLFLLFLAANGFSQERFELTPDGFAPVVITRPDKTDEKLIESSKFWAATYNKDEHDVYEITENSLSIDALRNNAFFYRNLGEIFKYRIRYTLKVSFEEKTCTIGFIVKDIYTERTLTKTTIADFYTADGRIKEDYQEVKPSLEITANKILRSYVNALSN